MKQLVPIKKNKEEYQALVGDIHAIIKERTYRARMEIIEGKWDIGDLILNFGEEPTQLIKRLSNDLKCSERELWRCLSFRKQCENLEKLDTPDGKNLSWNKICNSYLPLHNDKHHKHQWIKAEVCSICRCIKPNK